MTGFYMKRNTGLKWVKVEKFRLDKFLKICQRLSPSKIHEK